MTSPGLDARESSSGPVVASCPAWVREAFAATIGHPDVTLEALGWSVVESDDGPAYRFGWPS